MFHGSGQLVLCGFRRKQRRSQSRLWQIIECLTACYVYYKHWSTSNQDWSTGDQDWSLDNQSWQRGMCVTDAALRDQTCKPLALALVSTHAAHAAYSIFSKRRCMQQKKNVKPKGIEPLLLAELEPESSALTTRPQLHHMKTAAKFGLHTT
jgi:hypothetical protein